MKIPAWFKPGAWGALAGAIAMAIVGFTQLGWKTGNAAEQLAQSRSEAAVVSALVPFCVAKAQMDPDPDKLIKLRADQSSYSRNEMVTKAGWATLGADKNPDSGLARACSERLRDMKAG